MAHRGKKKSPEPKYHISNSKNDVNYSKLVMKILNLWVTNDGEHTMKHPPQTNLSKMFAPTKIIKRHIPLFSNYKTAVKLHETEGNIKQQYHEMANIVTLLNMDANQLS